MSRRLRHAKALDRLDDARSEAAYADAAVFVSPARYEPFGLNLLEATHAGCTLVLADIHSFREIWGDVAAYFAVGDADALRDALERVCHDRALRRRLSLAAKRRAMRLTQARQARDHDACCRTLVARQEGSPFAS